MAARLVLGPLVGGLTHRSARLWGRSDSPAILTAWLARRDDLGDAHVAGRVRVSESSGLAGVVPLERLQAESTYYYALRPDSRRPAKKEFRSFRTFPRPGQRRSFRFAFGSCFRPARRGAGGAFRHILETEHDLAFLLMLGDQIYADEWQYNGLGRIARTYEDYRQVYLHTWSNPFLRELLARTPVFMILDDHEVDNDWHWTEDARQQAAIPLYTRLWRWLAGRPRGERELSRQHVQAALRAYWEHQGMHAPPPLLPFQGADGRAPVDLLAGEAGAFAYTFTYGAATFFVLDTRTLRVRNRRQQTLLGEAQWRVLQEWLREAKEAYPLKFIVTSSAILFEMWGDFAKDRWSGFPQERERLFHFLAENEIEGVYFIAGDLHEAHAISAHLQSPRGRRIPLWEFCATPFEQQINWPARLLIVEPSSKALHEARLHFSVGHINYGIVEVHFDRDGKPSVTYTVRYEEGGAWRSIQP